MKVKRAGKSGSVNVRGRGLVPGQLVRGRVITRLGAGRFRIGAAGYVFNAQSDLPLEVGQRLTARVEPGEARIILRLLEDGKGKRPPREQKESPEEIRRVLKGLGIQPDDLEIIAFAERLQRYRSVVRLPAGEPSSVWILAILWVRGIRGGADAYALTGFILRYASLQAPGDACGTSPADVLQALEDDPPVEREPEPSSSQPDFSARFLVDRRREAMLLLNRNAKSCGSLRLGHGSLNTAGCLVLPQAGGKLSRWVDNPASPRHLVETARSQGRMNYRLHFVDLKEGASRENRSRWEAEWKRELERRGIETESADTILQPDSESLRFLFWRKWDRERFLNEIR